MTLLRKSYYTLILTFFSICALAIAQPPLVYGIDGFNKNFPDPSKLKAPIDKKALSDKVRFEPPSCLTIELDTGLRNIEDALNNLSRFKTRLQADRLALKTYLEGPWRVEFADCASIGVESVDVDATECKRRYRREALAYMDDVMGSVTGMHLKVLETSTLVDELHERCSISEVEQRQVPFE